MSSPKFPLELRLAVVTHYLNSRDGYRETANRFGVGRTAVRRWVSAWQQHGIDGLTWKTGIAYSLSERPVMALVDTMLDKAFMRLTPGDAPVLHTDQGWQYQMTAYQDRLRAAGVVQSMSRKGNCLDNAMAESFFCTLKSECFYLEEFSSVPALREDIDTYIYYYNHERISLRLNGLSPVEFRLLHLKAA